MGRIGEIVEYKDVTLEGDKAGEITVDLGGGDVVTVLDCNPAGLFAKPKKGDLAVIVEIDRAEEYALVGVIDVSRANPMAAGEIVIYSRKSDGAYAGFANLKNTGEVVIGNTSGTVVISENGHITLANQSNTLVLNSSGCAINGHLTVAVE